MAHGSLSSQLLSLRCQCHFIIALRCTMHLCLPARSTYSLISISMLSSFILLRFSLACHALRIDSRSGPSWLCAPRQDSALNCITLCAYTHDTRSSSHIHQVMSIKFQAMFLKSFGDTANHTRLCTVHQVIVCHVIYCTDNQVRFCFLFRQDDITWSYVAPHPISYVIWNATCYALSTSFFKISRQVVSFVPASTKHIVITNH